MQAVTALDVSDQDAKRAQHYETVRTHYDELAPSRAKWIAKNRYFYRRDLKNLRTIIPEDARILEIGCGNGATGALALTHGTTAGNKGILAASTVQLTNPRTSEGDNMVMLAMDMIFLPSSAGNDELIYATQ